MWKLLMMSGFLCRLTSLKKARVSSIKDRGTITPWSSIWGWDQTAHLICDAGQHPDLSDHLPQKPNGLDQRLETLVKPMASAVAQPPALSKTPQVCPYLWRPLFVQSIEKRGVMSTLFQKAQNKPNFEGV